MNPAIYFPVYTFKGFLWYNKRRRCEIYEDNQRAIMQKERSFVTANIADRLNIGLGGMTPLELNNLRTLTL
jgi:hypothetical protein